MTLNRRMLVSIALVVLAGLAPGCQRPGTIDQSALVPIIWEGIGWSDRAALMVPATLEGQEVTLQLDTGASTCLNRTILDWLGIKYEIVGSAAGWHGQEDAIYARISEITFATITLRDSKVIISGPPLTDAVRAEAEAELVTWRSTHPTGGLPCGTLGADFFGGRSLYLDFVGSKIGTPDKRVAIDGTTLPMSLMGPRPVLSVEAPVKLKALFDTGSSPVQLMAPAEAFAQLTGAAPGSDATSKLTAQSWGTDIDVETADCRVELSIGSLRLPITKVFTGVLIEQLYKSTNGKADAIIGNEAFRGKIILINFARKTFTVADPK